MGVSATLFSLSHDDSLLIFLPHIREQYRLSHGSNGRPRMTIELKEVELDVGERRVGRLMGNHGIKPIRTRKHKVIKDRHLLLGVTANWLEGSFVAYAPCPKWAGDITDIWTSQGWPTLSVILDLDSWPVVGRTISDRMKTYLGIWALDMVARLRQPPGGRFFSIRTEAAHIVLMIIKKKLQAYDLRASMRGKENCYEMHPSRYSSNP